MPGAITAFPEEDAPCAVLGHELVTEPRIIMETYEDPDGEVVVLLEVVLPPVVPAALVGDEVEADPLKQLVLPGLDENTKSIKNVLAHTARLNREWSRLCRQSRVITESEIETSAW